MAYGQRGTGTPPCPPPWPVAAKGRDRWADIQDEEPELVVPGSEALEVPCLDTGSAAARSRAFALQCRQVFGSFSPAPPRSNDHFPYPLPAHSLAGVATSAAGDTQTQSGGSCFREPTGSH